MNRLLVHIGCLLFVWTFYAPAASSQTTLADSVEFDTRFSIGYSLSPVFYLGDVKSTDLQTNFIDRIGNQIDLLEVQLPHSNHLGFSIFSGRIYGDEFTSDKMINFRTSLNVAKFTYYKDFDQFGGYLGYDFDLKKNKYHYLPYAGVGVGMLWFMSYGDLLDAEGNAYHLWADGNLYDQGEISEKAAIAKKIERDYTYETNLRDMNLDGQGKYRQYAFVVPIVLGGKLFLSDRWSVRLAMIYHLPFTDMMDNISNEGMGIRKGNAMNDQLFSVHTGLSYNLKFRKLTASEIAMREQKYLKLNQAAVVLNDSSVLEDSPTQVFDSVSLEHSPAKDTAVRTSSDLIEVPTQHADKNLSKLPPMIEDTIVRSAEQQLELPKVDTLLLSDLITESMVDSAFMDTISELIAAQKDTSIKEMVYKDTIEAPLAEEPMLVYMEEDSLPKQVFYAKDSLLENEWVLDSLALDSALKPISQKDSLSVPDMDKHQLEEEEVTEELLDQLFFEDEELEDRSDDSLVAPVPTQSFEIIGEIPPQFSKFDLNNNGYIERNELDHAIDRYFEYAQYKGKEMIKLLAFFHQQKPLD